jgi:hypothetical protein
LLNKINYKIVKHTTCFFNPEIAKSTVSRSFTLLLVEVTEAELMLRAIFAGKELPSGQKIGISDACL